MIVVTDPNYWDCDCDENYIHKKDIIPIKGKRVFGIRHNNPLEFLFKTL